jgi:general secretion pathway protein D
VRESAQTPDSDRFVTRLIPLRFIDAQAIADTLKPLVSKDASLVSYPPTNTVILTDSASNIRRIVDIIESIDVESYKEELAVLKVRRRRRLLAGQLSEIFGAEVSDAAAPGAAAARARARRPGVAGQQPGPELLTPAERVRLITDERTNSIIVLAARPRLEEIRQVVAKLDVPVSGGGRIHVYYLKHADSEELSQTLSALISGQAVPASTGVGGGRLSGGSAGGGAERATAGAAQALRSSISELAGGVTVTADPPTNSLLIQASQEGFNTLSQVIAQLDIPRPSVLVEALIMEVDVTDSIDLGCGLVASRARQPVRDRQPHRHRAHHREGDTTGGVLDNLIAALAATGELRGRRRHHNRQHPDPGPDPRQRHRERHQHPVGAAHPHARQRGGRDQGRRQHPDHLEPRAVGRGDHHRRRGRQRQQQPSHQQEHQRQDIGITLRVTPQISEGDTLRLKIFQEITNINRGLIADTGDPNQVGVPLSSRKIENNVVVSDGETVVIGGLSTRSAGRRRCLARHPDLWLCSSPPRLDRSGTCWCS